MSTANIDLTASKQKELRATVYPITVLASVFVALRFVARAKRGAGFKIDDWMLVVALVFLLGLAALTLLMIYYGVGLHAGALSIYKLRQIMKSLLIHEVLYVATNGLVKVSLLLMYCRIFTFRRIRWQVLVLGFMAVGWSVSIVFAAIFQCSPMERAWDPTLPGTCVRLKLAFITAGILNIITDVLILCVPVPLVWGLHTSLARRLSLLFIFSLGSFVVFASIYRFITLFEFQETDTSWTLARSIIWCLVECSAGVISTCLPTLRPLVQMAASGLNSTNKASADEPVGSHVATIGSSSNASRTKPRHFRRIDDTVLRHDCNDSSVTTTAVRGQLNTAGSGGDEIPLNAISVRTDVEWSDGGSTERHV